MFREYNNAVFVGPSRKTSTNCELSSLFSSVFDEVSAADYIIQPVNNTFHKGLLCVYPPTLPSQIPCTLRQRFACFGTHGGM